MEQVAVLKFFYCCTHTQFLFDRNSKLCLGVSVETLGMLSTES